MLVNRHHILNRRQVVLLAEVWGECFDYTAYIKKYKSNTFCGKTTHNIPLKQPLLTVCHNSVSPTLIIESPDFDNSHEGGPGWLPQWERAQVYNKCLSSPGHWLTAVITLVHWAPKHGGTLQGVWAIGHRWSNEEQHFVLTGSIMMRSVK